MTRSRLLGEAGFAHLFPERGTTDAEALADLGLSPRETPRGLVADARIVQVKQVHGARVVMARDAPGAEGDAIVARASEGRVAVGVRVADCVPVLAASPETGDVAAIHAGWRGVTLGVIQAALGALGGGRVVAAIGPCIGACCFEVGRDVASQIAAAAPGARVVSPRAHASPDKAYVDLRAAVRQQLRAAGVGDDRIDDVAGCTMHEAARFHSFRRDGADSGRMLASIVTNHGPRP